MNHRSNVYFGLFMVSGAGDSLQFDVNLYSLDYGGPTCGVGSDDQMVGSWTFRGLPGRLGGNSFHIWLDSPNRSALHEEVV
jgi:hypothetical protein